jgi:hypothetical protein
MIRPLLVGRFPMSFWAPRTMLVHVSRNPTFWVKVPMNAPRRLCAHRRAKPRGGNAVADRSLPSRIFCMAANIPDTV